LGNNDCEVQDKKENDMIKRQIKGQNETPEQLPTDARILESFLKCKRITERKFNNEQLSSLTVNSQTNERLNNMNNIKL
jgi:hypothetical protein